MLKLFSCISSVLSVAWENSRHLVASRIVSYFLRLFSRSFCLFPCLKSRISYFPAVLASLMMAIITRALGVEETSASWPRHSVSIQSLGLGPTAVEIKSPSSWSKLKRTFSLVYNIYINLIMYWHFCVKVWIFHSYVCVVIYKYGKKTSVLLDVNSKEHARCFLRP